MKYKLKNKKFLLIWMLCAAGNIFAQDTEVTMFIFGHSLINHEFQINPTPSQETSVPHWMHFLAEDGGNSLKLSGQYGFLPQHANLPPIAQWGFDFVEGAWDSDNEPFSEANFTHVLLTPGNFIQWQAPTENYPNENLSPVSATNEIIQWCAAQEDNLQFYIYENWPDMAPYLSSGFPPAISEYQDYLDYTQGDFAAWFEEYHSALAESNPDYCVKLIPVGRLISELLQTEPYNQIHIQELYEDDAPHGRPSIYFLAAMISYMAIYEEELPFDYQANEFIDPIIVENYQAIGEFFWSRLISFNEENDESKVFCNIISSNNNGLDFAKEYIIHPNPVTSYFSIVGIEENVQVELFNVNGEKLKSLILSNENNRFSMEEFSKGIYFVRIKDENYSFQKLIKVSH